MAPSIARRKQPRKAPRKGQSARKLTRVQVSAAVQTMAAPSGTARFAAGKALSVTAEKDPSRVYPHFAALAALLESDSKIVRWNALQIVALLAPADTDHRLDALLDKYLAFIRGSNMVSAANAIRGAGQIARCRPDLLDRIIPAILEVERAIYETSECRNVAIGQALDALRELGPSVCRRPAVAGFVRRQRTNTRAAVARCAARMTADLASGA
jgi:hypothetical protein